MNRKRPASEAFEPSEQSKGIKRIKRLEEALSKAKEALQKAKAPAPTKVQKKADKAKRATLSLWYQRLRHVSKRVIKYLLKDIYHESRNPIGVLKDHFRKYEPYKKVSFTNKVNKISRNATQEYQYLKKVASDIYGPISPITYNKYCYFVTFLDKATRYLELKLLRLKDKTYNAFIEFQNRAENNPDGYQIRVYITDNSTKFVNKHFQSYFKAKGITY